MRRLSRLSPSVVERPFVNPLTEDHDETSVVRTVVVISLKAQRSNRRQPKRNGKDPTDVGPNATGIGRLPCGFVK